jgi:ankyrin repeat protein
MKNQQRFFFFQLLLLSSLPGSRVLPVSSRIAAVVPPPHHPQQQQQHFASLATSDLSNDTNNGNVIGKNIGRDPRLREDHSTESTLTHILASAGVLSDLRAYLRDQPSLVHSCDVDGWTVLHEAVAANHIDIVEYLLDHTDAEVNALTYRGASPLSLAERKHGPDSPMVRLLLSKGALLLSNVADGQGLLRGSSSLPARSKNDIERHGDL